MKKLLILLVTVAVGIVVGLLSTRQPSRKSAVKSGPSAPVESSVTAPSQPQLPAAPPPAQSDDKGGSNGSNLAHPVYAVPSVPMDFPDQREAQAALWNKLREYARDVQLTDAQWDQFVRDLTELAEEDFASRDSALVAKSPPADVAKKSTALEEELFVRCAAFMTDKQVRTLKFRFLGLVMQARHVAIAQTSEAFHDPGRDQH